MKTLLAYTLALLLVFGVGLVIATHPPRMPVTGAY